MELSEEGSQAESVAEGDIWAEKRREAWVPGRLEPSHPRRHH